MTKLAQKLSASHAKSNLTRRIGLYVAGLTLVPLMFGGCMPSNKSNPSQNNVATVKSPKTPELPVLKNNVITQADVNEEYWKIYNVIKQAKNDAEKEHKKLAVLQTTTHNSGNSLLSHILVTVVASHIGITQASEECDAETLSGIIKTDQVSIRNKDKSLDNTFKDVILPESVKRFMHRAYLISPITRFFNEPADGSTYSYDSDLNTNRVRMLITRDNGLEIFAADPAHDTRYSLGRKGQTDRTISPEFENPIADILIKKAQTDSFISVFGATHVPTMYDKLTAKGIPVLCIDCTAGTLTGLLSTKGDSSITPLVRERINKIYALSPHRFESFETSQQVSPATALRMVLNASALHQYQVEGGLSEKEYQAEVALTGVQYGQNPSSPQP